MPDEKSEHDDHLDPAYVLSTELKFVAASKLPEIPQDLTPDRLPKEAEMRKLGAEMPAADMPAATKAAKSRGESRVESAPSNKTVATIMTDGEGKGDHQGDTLAVETATASGPPASEALDLSANALLCQDADLRRHTRTGTIGRLESSLRKAVKMLLDHWQCRTAFAAIPSYRTTPGSFPAHARSKENQRHVPAKCRNVIWHCKLCQERNFSKRGECRKCKARSLISGVGGPETTTPEPSQAYHAPKARSLILGTGPETTTSETVPMDVPRAKAETELSQIEGCSSNAPDGLEVAVPLPKSDDSDSTSHALPSDTDVENEEASEASQDEEILALHDRPTEGVKQEGEFPEGAPLPSSRGSVVEAPLPSYGQPEACRDALEDYRRRLHRGLL